MHRWRCLPFAAPPLPDYSCETITHQDAIMMACMQAREALEAACVPLPTVQLMTEFCRSAIIDSYMHYSLGLLEDTVTAIAHASIVLPEDGDVAGEVLLFNEWLVSPSYVT